ncbi:MAG: biotin--[acetyl-CoA-carboxylase] ligase [Gemmatimonadales bacterium]|nr:biotin--[acetyl-CoA-carboxylase] ligase [Gemmatimonadales bacterium]
MESLPSTMDQAHALAQEGAPHGTSVLADRQTGGRGQRGRRWASEGGGLWLSVIGRPVAGQNLGGLSLRIGLAVARALEVVIPDLPSIGLKWPNDLIIDGRKLGGILTEARWSDQTCLWIVAGVGLNVRNLLADELRPIAIRLAEFAPDIGPTQLADPIVAAVTTVLGEPGPLSSRELADFARRDVLLGTAVEQPVPGTAAGITTEGALVVRAADGTIHHCVTGVAPVGS